MRVAILGGTGGLGRGLVLRLGRDTAHDIVLGSRDGDRAERAADAFAEGIADTAGPDHPDDGSITGATNAESVGNADVVVVAVPPEPAPDLVWDLAPLLPADAVVVSTVVGIEMGDDGHAYRRPEAGSYAAAIAAAAPDHPVVGAFQAVPAGPLAALDEIPNYDVPVVGDSPDAVDRVSGLIDDCDGLTGVPAGSLECATTVEHLAPLLMSVGERTDRSGVGIRFV
jgi:NADPH-dependent F420 reductase